ncbi:hypothetical protein EV426DRAFT_710963 [Tirmania nivea]|nr:hypothetical protein EV426DRAFT_710963 [Tirmania nivea]
MSWNQPQDYALPAVFYYGDRLKCPSFHVYGKVLRSGAFSPGATSVSGLKGRFFVEKDMAVVKSQLVGIMGDIKDLNKKIDTMFFCLVLLMAGGVIVKGAFDFYRDERAWSRSSQVKGYNEHEKSMKAQVLASLGGVKDTLRFEG